MRVRKGDDWVFQSLIDWTQWDINIELMMGGSLTSVHSGRSYSHMCNHAW